MTNFNGLLREKIGTANARRLRKKDHIPVVLYTKDQGNVLLSIEHKAIFYAEQQESFYENPMTLQWTNALGQQEQRPVVIKEVQRHPFKNCILHVDFSTV